MNPSENSSPAPDSNPANGAIDIDDFFRVPANFYDPPRTRFPMRVRITPELALAWLDLNTNNRPFKETEIQLLKADLAGGRFRENGETIKFSAAGRLLDGQNRLRACAECGISFWSDVSFGLEDEVQTTIDIGSVRTTADIFHFANIPDPGPASALTKLILIHDSVGLQYLTAAEKHPSKPKMREAAPKLPGLQNSIDRGRSQKVSPRIASACHYLFARQNKELADRFFDELRSGAALPEESPVRLLRERLIANRESRAKLPAKDVFAYFFIAWVAYRDGLPLRILRWRGVGVKAEPFPSIELSKAGGAN